MKIPMKHSKLPSESVLQSCQYNQLKKETKSFFSDYKTYKHSLQKTWELKKSMKKIIKQKHL